MPRGATGHSFRFIGGLAAAVLLLVACGGEEDEEALSEAIAPTATVTAVATVEAVTDAAITDFVAELERAGVSVEVQESVSRPFLSVDGSLVSIEGETIEVYAYDSQSAAQADVSKFSDDATTVDGTPTPWDVQPHVYQEENLLVIYDGSTQIVLETLEVALGPQVAGTGETAARGTPASGTPVADADLDEFLSPLRAVGLNVEVQETVSQPFLSVDGQAVSIDDETMQVYVYPNAAAAKEDAAKFSEDASSVNGTMVEWVGTPHVYQEEKLLVIYLGDTEEVLEVLEVALGPQVAGQ